jgi:hypothetical protein
MVLVAGKLRGAYAPIDPEKSYEWAKEAEVVSHFIHFELFFPHFPSDSGPLPETIQVHVLTLDSTISGFVDLFLNFFSFFSRSFFL